MSRWAVASMGSAARDVLLGGFPLSNPRVPVNLLTVAMRADLVGSQLFLIHTAWAAFPQKERGMAQMKSRDPAFVATVTSQSRLKLSKHVMCSVPSPAHFSGK
jgi:hypothetical protein